MQTIIMIPPNGLTPMIATITPPPVMKYAVIGVITDRITPHAIPAYITVSMIHAFMIGPVINILRFLKI